MPWSAARVLSLLIAVAVGLLWAAVVPSSAYGCTCRGTSNHSSAWQADAIFLGTVIDKEAVRKPAPGRTDLRFSVSRVYKGSVYAEQVVASPAGKDSCGIDPEVDSTWVIFAEEDVLGTGDGAVVRLVTRLCSGNVPGSVAPVHLGQGQPPIPGVSDRGERAAATDAAFTKAIKTGGIGLLALVVLAGSGLAVLWRPGRDTT